jgi:hypothetical protein
MKTCQQLIDNTGLVCSVERRDEVVSLVGGANSGVTAQLLAEQRSLLIVHQIVGRRPKTEEMSTPPSSTVANR